MFHHPRKRFGQHFLHDRNIINKILLAINPRPGETLVEIGPGRGALTLPLLERHGQLIAVELDRDVIPQLQADAVGKGELRVIQGDALKTDFPTTTFRPFRNRSPNLIDSSRMTSYQSSAISR